MASSSSSLLLRLTRSLLPFRPSLTKPLSAYPLTRQHSVVNMMTQPRPFSSSSWPPQKCTSTLALSFLFSQMEMGPSMLVTLVKDEELTLHMPGLDKKKETEEGVWVSFDVPRLGKKGWNLNLGGFNFIFQLIAPDTDTKYVAIMNYPEYYDPHGHWNVKIEDGVCYVCIPTQKTIDPFLAKANLNRDLTRPTPCCEMFDRSDLGRRLCELIAYPGVKSKSFTAYKKDDGESIYFKGNLPGVESIVVTREGLCVSLSMPGFEIEDVEVGFQYDTLIIEGKREGEHYIAGVRVPEGFQREDHLIKKEMLDGVYKATLPRLDGNKLVFSVYAR